MDLLNLEVQRVEFLAPGKLGTQPDVHSVDKQCRPGLQETADISEGASRRLWPHMKKEVLSVHNVGWPDNTLKVLGEGIRDLEADTARDRFLDDIVTAFLVESLAYKVGRYALTLKDFVRRVGSSSRSFDHLPVYVIGVNLKVKITGVIR
jgi:hypothetical protein